MSLINKVKEYYYYLPEWLLNLGSLVYYALPERIRYGKSFSETLKTLRRTELLSQKEIDKLIDERFIYTVKHAYAHVPFYKELYDTYGVDVNTIHGIKDINKLPFIDKDTIKNYSPKMIVDDIDKRKTIYVTTSGSTGDPIGFYQPDSITMKEWAYTVQIWNRVGYKLDSSRLVLRGKKLHPAGVKDNYFYDPLRKELSCNIFDMRDDTMAVYCKAIEKYKPEFVHGYMSAIIMLAKYIDRKKVSLKHQFKAILATSENIIEEQKQYVEKIFNTRVFSFYGHSERLIIAGECEVCSDYHVEPLYGYCEIVDEYGNNAADGEIVATGFINQVMPLIRYKTGDMAYWSTDYKCKCGRCYKKIKRVTGRWNQDMLINQEGAYVSLTALNIHSSEFDRVIRYKFIQNEVGKVQMLLQVAGPFSEADSKNIKRLLEEKVCGKICFYIRIVEQIPTLKNGKYRIVEQNLKLN